METCLGHKDIFLEHTKGAKNTKLSTQNRIFNVQNGILIRSTHNSKMVF